MDAMKILQAAAGSPAPWMVLAGIFVGATLSRLTRRSRPGRDPDHERTRRWVAACLLLCLAVLCALLAVFLPGPARVTDLRLAWAAGAAAVISFVALRFRKAAGIPIVLLVAALVISVGLFLRSIHAFTGETEIAVVRVISASDTSMRLELAPRGEGPVLLTMKGVYFTPIVKVVIFDDLLVFLGGRTWYRFEGLTSFDANMRQQDTDYRFANAPGISERLWSFFEANEASIPGVKTAQVEMTSKRAKELATFNVMVQNDGGVEIVPRS